MITLKELRLLHDFVRQNYSKLEARKIIQSASKQAHKCTTKQYMMVLASNCNEFSKKPVSACDLLLDNEYNAKVAMYY